jgi:hypothetical protein
VGRHVVRPGGGRDDWRAKAAEAARLAAEAKRAHAPGEVVSAAEAFRPDSVFLTALCPVCMRRLRAIARYDAETKAVVFRFKDHHMAPYLDRRRCPGTGGPPMPGTLMGRGHAPERPDPPGYPPATSFWRGRVNWRSIKEQASGGRPLTEPRAVRFVPKPPPPGRRAGAGP